MYRLSGVGGKTCFFDESGRDIDFRGIDRLGKEFFCDGSYVEDLKFYPTESLSINFNLSYSCYKIISSGVVKTDGAEIEGIYNPNNKSFNIFSITYYYR